MGVAEPERVDILGVGVSAVDMERALAVIGGWIEERSPHYVCVRDVHGIVLSQHDEELRRIHDRAGLVTPDGMPLVWLSRLRGHRWVERVYGPDLMLAACEASLRLGWRHFLYGGDEGVAGRLADRLRERFPGLAIAGTYTPPFRPLAPDEDREVIERIERSRADIVWVGLGTPKQERWMAEHVARVAAPVLIGVGAAFDFHAGVKRQAPRWMQRNGLEWLFRLASEPRRLAGRYLRSNPEFLRLLLLDALGVRRRRRPPRERRGS
jgi:N-acetylglucosaminyldiphosphoundecaprenol N-acetyl-beta-D-mannosaminyltransferase